MQCWPNKVMNLDLSGVSICSRSLYVYKTKSQESTGESLFYLSYGHKARLQTESVLDVPPSSYLIDCEDYQVELVRGLFSACLSIISSYLFLCFVKVLKLAVNN